MEAWTKSKTWACIVCVCVCVCVFRGQRAGLDTVQNQHDPWCLKHKVWGLGGWRGRHRPSRWSLSLQLQEVLDFPMIRSHTCFRNHGVRRRTFILFSTSLYIFKVKSSYFRGKNPNIGYSYNLLFWHCFCFWTTSGRMEVDESWSQVSWMQCYSFPGWVLLIYFDFFLNWSIVNL